MDEVSETSSDGPVEEGIAYERDQAVDRLRRRLRRIVRDGELTQREIEAANGFSRGYLSQVLHGNITLSVRHLYGILLTLGILPAGFFRDLHEGSYEEGPPNLDGWSEIRERLARYDAALDQLRERGLIEEPSSSPESDPGDD